MHDSVASTGRRRVHRSWGAQEAESTGMMGVGRDLPSSVRVEYGERKLYVFPPCRQMATLELV